MLKIKKQNILINNAGAGFLISSTGVIYSTGAWGCSHQIYYSFSASITIAVTNKKLRDRLSAINAKIGGWKEGFDPFYGAPAILIVLADKNWANRVYDGSLVMGNMMLLFVVYL